MSRRFDAVKQQLVGMQLITARVLEMFAIRLAELSFEVNWMQFVESSQSSEALRHKSALRKVFLSKSAKSS
jgi:hypothetical protein